MSLLNFTSRRPGFKNNKFLASATIIAVSVTFLLLKTTFAANISLNNGQSVEYGQGVAQATACSGGSSINISPSESFVNSSGGGNFTFTGFTVSNVPTTCQGDTLQIDAYDSTNNAPLALYQTSLSDVDVRDGSGSFSLPAGTIGLSVISLSSTSYSVNFTNPVAGSNSVYKLGIQSFPTTVVLTCAQGGSCSLGDTGPGGGIVFYTSVSAFTETGATCSSNCHYLEYAPSGWYPPHSDGLVWWSSDSTDTLGSTSTSVGSGFSNTAAMLTSSGSYTGDTYAAAYISHQYAGTDSSAGQWFLPSVGEIGLLANSSAKSLGNFQNLFYWSSSEYSGNSAYGENLNYPSGFNAKQSNCLVRPIRAF